MPQYLVCNYLPDDFDPSTVTEAMIEEIHALNRELIAAGARKFACGISPAANAKTLRKQPDGRVLVTDGPYTETKEHMGGFGYWKPPIWMRHLHGRRRLPSPAMSPARCASFFSSRLRDKESLASRQLLEMRSPAACAQRAAGFGVPAPWLSVVSAARRRRLGRWASSEDRAEQAVRAGRRGRRGPAGRRAGPRRLRLRPRRPRPDDAVRHRCRMARHEPGRDGGARQRSGRHDFG